MGDSGSSGAAAESAEQRLAPPWLLATLALVLLHVASPGAVGRAAPGEGLLAGWPGLLVVPGLAALFALIRSARRPYASAYLVGVLHVWAFSASLRFVSLPGLIGIGLVGGLYFVLLAVWTRGFGARPGLPVVGFALGVAAAAWIRSHIPEIPYPHGQPIHALYRFPGLLAPLSFGGEFFGNLLLAGVSAGAFVAWRRRALGRRRFAALSGFGLAWGVLTLFGAFDGELGRVSSASAVATDSAGGGAAPEPRDPGGSPSSRFRVVVVEPGLPSVEQLAEVMPPGLDAARLSPVERIQAAFHYGRPLTRCAEATSTRLRLDLPAPDLVIWPESAVLGELQQAADGSVRADSRLANGLSLLARDAWRGLPGTARLLVGTVLRDAGGDRHGVVASFAADGSLDGWHEKQWPVPAGERMPFLDLLPRGLIEWIVEQTGTILASLPDMRPGEARPPLSIAASRPGGDGPPGGDSAAEPLLVAALLCFDNAFEGVAARAASAGAQLLVVASNEAWYLQGAELEQMIAMSVCRSVETGLPVVRSTIDGRSAVIDPAGRLVAATDSGRIETPRILEVAVVPRTGSRPWEGLRSAFRSASGYLVLVTGVLAATLLFAASRRRRADRRRNPVATQP